MIFGGAITLDSYLARPDHAVDWIRWSDESSSVMADYWKAFDTILMGRKTYEVAAASGRSVASPGMATYVFSRTLKNAGKGATLISTDAAKFVRELKEREGKDEVGFNIHPILLGAGVPLFHPMPHQIDLELKECKPFRNGCVLLTYRVKH